MVADNLKMMKPVTNFSSNACRHRHEALLAGTAKPTPESIFNPDEKTLARIISRQQKEAQIEADKNMLPTSDGHGLVSEENIESNAWEFQEWVDFE